MISGTPKMSISHEDVDAPGAGASNAELCEVGSDHMLVEPPGLGPISVEHPEV